MQVDHLTGSLLETLGDVPALVIRGNHLSNTTCLTQMFFKSGE